MKKLIVFVMLFAFVACMATAAFAENPIQKGAKALSGFVANWRSDKPDQGDTQTSYDIGGAFEYFLTDNGALRIGVEFAQADAGKGNKASESFFSFGYKYNFRQAEAATFPYLRASYGFGNRKVDVGGTVYYNAYNISTDVNGFGVGLGLEHLIGNAAVFGEVVYSPTNYKTSGATANSTILDLNLGLKFYF
ncbi:MAG: hypothetical protein V2A78_09055 [bacterium]